VASQAVKSRLETALRLPLSEIYRLFHTQILKQSRKSQGSTESKVPISQWIRKNQRLN